MDFVNDKLADGAVFRVLAVVEVFRRECVTLLAGRRLSGPWSMESDRFSSAGPSDRGRVCGERPHSAARRGRRLSLRPTTKAPRGAKRPSRSPRWLETVTGVSRGSESPPNGPGRCLGRSASEFPVEEFSGAGQHCRIVFIGRSRAARPPVVP